MFKWDGSEVSDFLNLKDVYWEETIYRNKIIWRIYYKEKEELCYVKATTNYLQCLIDEFKPILNINKIGTHWTKWKGKYLILSKPNIKKGKIIEDVPLFEIGIYNETLKREIRNIFLFRELLGLSRSNEKSIVCRMGKKVTPISFYEPNMLPNKRGKVLSNQILNKWFGGSLDEYLKDFLQIYDKNITKYIFNLRIKMEKVVNRLDNKALPYIDLILSRIQSRLQHILI